MIQFTISRSFKLENTPQQGRLPKSFGDIETIFLAIPEEIKEKKLENQEIFFSMMGGLKVQVKRGESEDNAIYRFVDSRKNEFYFDLSYDNSSSNAVLHFHGSFNPVVEMLARKPLNTFFVALLENLLSSEH